VRCAVYRLAVNFYTVISLTSSAPVLMFKRRVFHYQRFAAVAAEIFLPDYHAVYSPSVGSSTERGFKIADFFAIAPNEDRRFREKLYTAARLWLKPSRRVLR
jgi:hypothetical protein